MKKQNKSSNNRFISYIFMKIVVLVILTITMVVPINKIISIIKEKELQRREKAIEKTNIKWKNKVIKEYTSIEQL